MLRLTAAHGKGLQVCHDKHSLESLFQPDALLPVWPGFLKYTLIHLCEQYGSAMLCPRSSRINFTQNYFCQPRTWQCECAKHAFPTWIMYIFKRSQSLTFRLPVIHEEQALILFFPGWIAGADTIWGCFLFPCFLARLCEWGVCKWGMQKSFQPLLHVQALIGLNKPGVGWEGLGREVC